jgi:hypothetical protein
MWLHSAVKIRAHNLRYVKCCLVCGIKARFRSQSYDVWIYSYNASVFTSNKYPILQVQFFQVQFYKSNFSSPIFQVQFYKSNFTSPILQVQFFQVQFYKSNFICFARSTTEQMPALVIIKTRHAISCVVNFYITLVATQGRRIGSSDIFCDPSNLSYFRRHHRVVRPVVAHEVDRGRPQLPRIEGVHSEPKVSVEVCQK